MCIWFHFVNIPTSIYCSLRYAWVQHADLQAQQGVAANQQGVTHYAQMLYAALAVLKLTTLIQPATASDKGDWNRAVKDLCWALLDNLTKQLQDMPVPVSRAVHATEEQVAPALVEVLIPVMRQTVKGSPAEFTKACDLMVVLVRKSNPALAATIVTRIVAAGRAARHAISPDPILERASGSLVHEA